MPSSVPWSSDTFVRTGLIPRQHDIEKIAVDRNVLHSIVRSRRDTPRIHGRNRIARALRPAFHDFRNRPLVQEFERAGNDVDRAFLGVTFLEQQLLRGQLANLHLSCQCSEVVPLQAVQWRKGLEQVDIQLLIRHMSFCPCPFSTPRWPRLQSCQARISHYSNFNLWKSGTAVTCYREAAHSLPRCAA